MSTACVSRAVEAANAETTQQPATKAATGIQPLGPSPSRLWLMTGAKSRTEEAEQGADRGTGIAHARLEHLGVE